MKSLERLLADLVAIPSVNPAFLPAGDARAGEANVGKWLSDQAGRAGLEVEAQTVFPGRSNVLFRLEPSGRARSQVLLAPHLDTIGGPGDWAVLFQPRVRAGRLHGRGACDTKGSVAAMFHALRRLAAQGVRPRETRIVFAGLIDEENGQAGSRFLAPRLRASLAIVGEPTQLKVVTAHKGDIWLRIRTVGVSAHGSRPELGKNAVSEMAKVVRVLETEYAAVLRGRRQPVLRPPTLNVGTIAGGTQPNVVPDSCEISVDRRTVPGETEASVRRELRALFRRHRLRAEVENSRAAACHPLATDSRLPLVQRFLRGAGQRRGLGVDYFCDAAVLGAAGTPSVVFGPGDIAQAHTADEWISLASLRAAEALLFRFLAGLP